MLGCVLTVLAQKSEGERHENTLMLKNIELEHEFVRYDLNHLYIAPDSTLMEGCFDKWIATAKSGQGHVNIVHLGSSHVQGGTLSNRIRRNLLANYPFLVSDRGMIFPYSAAAKCNNPPDYKVHCPQKMLLTRNVYIEYPHPLGLCGISVAGSDSLSYIDIVLCDRGVDYATNRVVIFGESNQGVVPVIRLDDRDIAPHSIDSLLRRYEFRLDRPTDSFRILLPCKEGESFTLTGVYVGNGKPGFSFHSIGVNGASLMNYLRCEYFVRDLQMIRPDMLIFGIGVNDAAGPNFDTVVFRQQYQRLIDSVRSVNPLCAFVFITNNDTYRRVKKSYAVNPNGALARDVFYRLADANGGAVWDQFEVMGGLRSMDKWRTSHLAQNDRVHFTRVGYELIGDLFSNAVFEAVNNYESRRNGDITTNPKTKQ